MKRIYFTVTNDLTYDQRMQRICGSLQRAGFDVVLVGRKRKQSVSLPDLGFRQVRLNCIFEKGFLFYAEYNLRLFFFLLFKRMEGICAIDLDTILPCLFISRLKRIPRIYDAHEFFTEMKEVRTRPRVQRFWLWMERFSVPQFRWGYTVSDGLAQQFLERYDRHYPVIRNLPVLRPLDNADKTKKFIMAQGAVNEARAFEYLIPAMKQVPYQLLICGDGNFMPQLKKLIEIHGVQDRVKLMGMVRPWELWPLTQQATIGMAIAESEGIHQFMALPNKFFDYIQAGLPQIAMAHPEYEKINRQFKVAVLMNNLSVESVASTINQLMENEELLNELHQNCLEARKVYCWQQEEQVLLDYYRKIFNGNIV